MRTLLTVAAVVVALFNASQALADPCIIGAGPETTSCSDAQIAAMLPQYQPHWWKARFAQPSAEEQYQSAMRAEALRERAIAFDARLANELAEQQYAREAKARKSHFVQGLLGAIVAPLAQAGADRLSGYGGRGYYGNYSRGGYYGSGQAGYYPGTGYAGGVDPGRRTIPARSYCNPRAGEYCP